MNFIFWNSCIVISFVLVEFGNLDRIWGVVMGSKYLVNIGFWVLG